MPTFENIDIEVTQKIDIDFEVYCNTCGAGLCGESDTRRSRNRGYLQVSVNACPSCMKIKDDEIKSLQADIEELNNAIYRLETQLSNVVNL